MGYVLEANKHLCTRVIIFREIRGASNCVWHIKVCLAYQGVLGVSKCVQCIKVCSEYQSVFGVSKCVRCIKVCSVYQSVFGVSKCVWCIKVCLVYPTVFKMSRCCIRGVPWCTKQSAAVMVNWCCTWSGLCTGIKSRVYTYSCLSCWAQPKLSTSRLSTWRTIYT